MTEVVETVELDEATGTERRTIVTTEIVVGADGKKKKRTSTKTVTTKMPTALPFVVV